MHDTVLKLTEKTLEEYTTDDDKHHEGESEETLPAATEAAETPSHTLPSSLTTYTKRLVRRTE
jgi:hypothetical protein